MRNGIHPWYRSTYRPLQTQHERELDTMHAFLITTEVLDGGANHRTCHLVYAKTQAGATRVAREREAQAWQGVKVVTIVTAFEA
jgi:hypothetical protein